MVARTIIAVVVAAMSVEQLLAQSSLSQSFDQGWLFYRGPDPSSSQSKCTDKDFPIDLGNLQCMGLSHTPDGDISTAACQNACCGKADCDTWQYCAPTAKCDHGCWLGKMNDCHNSTGWVSRARASTPSPSRDCSKDSSAYCNPQYDDQHWRKLDVPHDWSIEDLPSREEDITAPVMAPRYGTWSFNEGDNPEWSEVSFDDSKWAKVKGGQDWRVASKYTKKNAAGWYRQTVNASALFRSSPALRLDLGVIAGVDETFLNGRKIGSTGSWGRPGCRDYMSWRSYQVPQGLLKPTGNVVAVRVFTLGGDGTYDDGTYPGGLYDDPVLKDADVRSGAWDAGATLNGRSYGYTVGGVGWYRKHFSANKAASGAVYRVQFDGVYMNSDMYINGHFLGNHPYGYTSFEYVLPSKYLKPSGNVLAVRVNNYGRNSRWYSGSGIFRHTYLTVTPPLRFQMWGLSVQTPMVDVAQRSATVQVSVTLASSAASPTRTKVMVALQDTDGKEVATGSITVSVPAHSSATSATNITVTNVSLWSPDTPTLYLATASLPTQGGEQLATQGGEQLTSTFGIRTLSFTAEEGFKINGKETKFYGGCMHHDNGPLGSKALYAAEFRRVKLLKAQGYNAIRTSHNPVSPAFLDACDRLGVMVMDEAFDCWARGKNTDDYHVWFDQWWQRDIESMVFRDRNHPSIVMWSIGNEIPMRASPAGYNLSKVLSDYVRKLDSGPTHVHTGRAVTSAYPGVSNAADKFFAPLDVAGYNYSPQRYVSDHTRFPKRIMVGTESFPKDSFQLWDSVWNHSWVMGDFIWTMFDYIGESDIGFESQSGDVDECAQEPYPWHISFCGDIDNAGHAKPQSYYRRVLWGVTPIEMAVHEPLSKAIAGKPDPGERVGGWGWPEERQSWTFPGQEGRNLSVNVYAKGGKMHDPAASCVEVDLSLNGKSLGRASVGRHTRYTATFSVPYAAGTISAKCFDKNNKVLGSTSYTTAGAVAKLELVPDRSSIHRSRDDLSFVTVRALDKHGVLVPDASVRVKFSLTPGVLEIAAVGNGDPQDIDSVQADNRLTWRGQAVVVLRPISPTPAAGKCTLTASADGVPSAQVTVSIA